jgi:heme-degrading monooxygenase HmoA
MFISQVTFEGNQSYEENIKSIIGQKLKELDRVEGLISAECWRKESRDTVGYTIVNKWESKECFVAWLSREEHAKGHRQMGNQDDRPRITKTACQYEMVDISTL